MFNPKRCPAYEKGRWYEIFVESDGNAYTLTYTDLEGVSEFGSNYVKLPKDFHVVDLLEDISATATVSTAFPLALKLVDADELGIVMPSKGAIDWVKIYVFGYFE